MPPVASLKALVSSVVDYAGLFPPAKLEMAATVRNYADYLHSNEQWMLGRLIVPVARLGEFEREAGRFLSRGTEDEPWQISALTAAAAELDKLESDLGDINRFNKKYADRATIDVIELRAETSSEIGAALERMDSDIFPFFEVPIDRDPRGLLAELADADAGAKVRTGGVTAQAYPTPGDLARFLLACAAADVPFKATAGLHHPLRHYSDAVKSMEFGFLNVFLAGCLLVEHDIDRMTLQEILTDERRESFTFTDQGAAWRHMNIDAQSLEQAREGFAVSFGSCSFDEPIDDLKAMTLL